MAALGALDELVAISHECDHPAEACTRPRVTASMVDPEASSRDIDTEVRRLASSGAPVFSLDAAQLARLDPTLILTQSLCEVCAVSDGGLRSLEEALDRPPALLSLGGTTLGGVWADIAAIGGALGREAEAASLLDGIAARLRHVHEILKAARAPRPRVAVIEWLDPLYAAGHWIPEVVRRAGGIDVLAQPGAHSAVVGAETIRGAAPDLLLLAPCGFGVERATLEGAALLATPGWEWARGIPAWALDGNALTSRPGPRLADAVETIASILAPTLFPAPPSRYARCLAS